MPTKDQRIDAYIDEADAFAQPILKRLRKLVHQGCPEVVETIKWHMPFFDYKGLLCGMAAFKAHCALVFWRDVKPKAAKPGAAMGQFGRITSLEDLPKDAVLVDYVRQAVRTRDEGKVSRKPRPKPAKALPIPADLKAALATKPEATEAFAKFSPSHRREYIEWITGAKRPETRTRRVATALEWIAEGKPQNWKYL